MFLSYGKARMSSDPASNNPAVADLPLPRKLSERLPVLNQGSMLQSVQTCNITESKLRGGEVHR